MDSSLMHPCTKFDANTSPCLSSTSSKPRKSKKATLHFVPLHPAFWWGWIFLWRGKVWARPSPKLTQTVLVLSQLCVSLQPSDEGPTNDSFSRQIGCPCEVGSRVTRKVTRLRFGWLGMDSTSHQCTSKSISEKIRVNLCSEY